MRLVLINGLVVGVVVLRMSVQSLRMRVVLVGIISFARVVLVVSVLYKVIVLLLISIVMGILVILVVRLIVVRIMMLLVEFVLVIVSLCAGVLLVLVLRGLMLIGMILIMVVLKIGLVSMLIMWWSVLLNIRRVGRVARVGKCDGSGSCTPAPTCGSTVDTCGNGGQKVTRTDEDCKDKWACSKSGHTTKECNKNKNSGTSCTRTGGGSGKCDGSGSCVECLSNGDCGSGKECVSNVCETINLPDCTCGSSVDTCGSGQTATSGTDTACTDKWSCSGSSCLTKSCEKNKNSGTSCTKNVGPGTCDSSGNCNPICNSLSSCKALKRSRSWTATRDSSSHTQTWDVYEYPGYKAVSCIHSIAPPSTIRDTSFCQPYGTYTCSGSCLEASIAGKLDCGYTAICTYLDGRLSIERVSSSQTSSGSSGWKKFTLTCSSGYTAAYCSHQLSGPSGYYYDRGDGDESKCDVGTNSCTIWHREAHVGWFDDYESGAYGTCSCIQIPS